MIKVYQDIIDNKNGNCSQAAIASLLELPICEVPHFRECDGDGIYKHTEIGFLRFHGFNPSFITRATATLEELKEAVAVDGGYNGYFLAIVPSQTYEGIYHVS